MVDIRVERLKLIGKKCHEIGIEGVYREDNPQHTGHCRVTLTDDLPEFEIVKKAIAEAGEKLAERTTIDESSEEYQEYLRLKKKFG